MNKTFVLATNNLHKLREFKEILSDIGVHVISLEEAGIQADPDENGTTFAENSMIKAKTVYNLCHRPTIADDSGLSVDALNGEPGVYSARYGGKSSDAERREYLLENMKDVPAEKRTAHFTSAIACILDEKTNFVVEGYSNGRIGFEEKGENGFGYDSLFLSDHFEGKTFAEISADEKNSISHRGFALQKLVSKLKEIQERIDD